MKSKLLHIFTALTLIGSLFGVALPAAAEVTLTQASPPRILFDEDPMLTVVKMWISPAEVNVGETVTITVNVTNASMTDTYWVDLYIDGDKEKTTVIDLDDGASEIVTFTTTKNIAGTYTATIGERSGTFIVKGSATCSTAASQNGQLDDHWWHYRGCCHNYRWNYLAGNPSPKSLTV